MGFKNGKNLQGICVLDKQMSIYNCSFRFSGNDDRRDNKLVTSFACQFNNRTRPHLCCEWHLESAFHSGFQRTTLSESPEVWFLRSLPAGLGCDLASPLHFFALSSLDEEGMNCQGPLGLRAPAQLEARTPQPRPIPPPQQGAGHLGGSGAAPTLDIRPPP